MTKDAATNRSWTKAMQVLLERQERYEDAGTRYEVAERLLREARRNCLDLGIPVETVNGLSARI
jgi:hypothetical protein